MQQHPKKQSEIRFLQILKSGQSLARILLDYEICCHCQRVYKMRMEKPHSCPGCKREITVGRIYAPRSVYSLINLIQDHYRMELSCISLTGEKTAKPKETRHNVGIILLFCTFVESWMGDFHHSLMVSRRLPKPVIDRLLSDNWRLPDRKGRLFKSMTNEAFGDVIRDLTQKKQDRRWRLGL